MKIVMKRATKKAMKNNAVDRVFIAFGILAMAAACLPKAPTLTKLPPPDATTTLNPPNPSADSRRQVTTPTFTAFAADAVEFKVTHNGEYSGDEEFTKAVKERGGGVLFAPVNKIALWKLEFKESSNSHIEVLMDSEDNSGIQCAVTQVINKFECQNIIENAGKGDLKFKVYSKAHCMNSLLRSMTQTQVVEKCKGLNTYPTDAIATKLVPFEAIDVGVATSSRQDIDLLCTAGFGMGEAIVGNTPNDSVREIGSAILKVLNAERSCKK